MGITGWIILAVVGAAVLFFVIPTFIMSLALYRVLLVRTKPEKWGRECSMPEDVEYRGMFEDGVAWREKYRDRMTGNHTAHIIGTAVRRQCKQRRRSADANSVHNDFFVSERIVQHSAPRQKIPIFFIAEGRSLALGESVGAVIDCKDIISRKSVRLGKIAAIQALSSVDDPCFYQIGGFWIDFYHYIRCLDVEFSGACDIRS